MEGVSIEGDGIIRVNEQGQICSAQPGTNENSNMAVISLEGHATDAAQYVILAPESGDVIDTCNIQTEDVGEPVTKKMKFVESGDQTFIVAVEGSEENAATLDIKEDGDESSAPSNTSAAIKKSGDNLDVSQAWFTTRDDKNALQNKGIGWKQGQWTKEEVDLLQNNINNYCKQNNISNPSEIIFQMTKDERKNFYRTVAKGLQRPLFSVYRRVTRMYDQKNHVGKYTADEIQKLRELRMKLGNDWAAIGAMMGRSASSVKDKCRLIKDTCNTGKWLPEEEIRLTNAVYDLSGVEQGGNITSGLSWSAVAESVGSRSEKQCRTKWLNYLNWKQQGGAQWNRKDDMTLIIRISELGVNDDTDIDWNELAKDWPSVRSPQWLRGKWWSLKRHVPNYNNLSFPALLQELRDLQITNVKMKSPYRVNNRVGLNLQVAGSPDLATLQIPMGLQSGSIGEDGFLQTIEVQPVSTSGTYLITQPHNNPAISFPSGTNLPTDHIIIHTLPHNVTYKGNENVAVQMNPQPQQIIIRTSGGDEVTAISNYDNTIHLSEESQALQTLTEAEQIAEVDDNVLHRQETLIVTQECSSLKTQDDAGIKPDDCASVSDVDMNMVGSVVSPQFVQTSSNDGELMSPLSDPMLPSGGADLIGSSSDIDEKGQTSELTDDLNDPNQC